MLLKPWLFIGATEILLTALAQFQMIPDNLIGILAQVPLVAVIIWLQLQNQKWLEHMLDVQRESIVSIYEGQKMFVNSLLNRVEEKQNKMSAHIEFLAQQVAITGANVSELSKIDDVIDRLLEKIEAK